MRDIAVATETDDERRKRLEIEIRAKIVDFDASMRLSREDLYHRRSSGPIFPLGRDLEYAE
jgi:hypothetical protein